MVVRENPTESMNKKNMEGNIALHSLQYLLNVLIFKFAHMSSSVSDDRKTDLTVTVDFRSLIIYEHKDQENLRSK